MVFIRTVHESEALVLYGFSRKVSLKDHRQRRNGEGGRFLVGFWRADTLVGSGHFRVCREDHPCTLDGHQE